MHTIKVTDIYLFSYLYLILKLAINPSAYTSFII